MKGQMLLPPQPGDLCIMRSWAIFYITVRTHASRFCMAVCHSGCISARLQRAGGMRHFVARQIIHYSRISHRSKLKAHCYF